MGNDNYRAADVHAMKLAEAVERHLTEHALGRTEIVAGLAESLARALSDLDVAERDEFVEIVRRYVHAAPRRGRIY